MSNKIFRAFFVLILVSGLVAVQAPQSARAAGLWYVTTTGDDNNNCLSPATPCSTINGAIGKASGGDTVYVAVGTYTGSGNEVVLLDKDVSLSGGWDVTFTTQSGVSTIDGEGVRRGVIVNTGITATLERFVAQNGSASFDNGGGISNSGTLTLNNSTVSGNSSSLGAGIFNTGILTLNNSSVSGNTALHGGGISNLTGTSTLNNSTITGNTAGDPCCTGGGGGAGIIVWAGTTTLNNSTISGNTIVGGFPGSAITILGGTVVLNNSTINGNTGSYDAIENVGQLTFNNSTLSGNANGIRNFVSVMLNNSTVANNTDSNNTPDFGVGGVRNEVGYSGTVMLRNSILAGNTVTSGSPADCSGAISSSGYNLIGDTSNCDFTATTGDLTNFDPNLGQLIGPYGAPSYHPLLAGSLAIDAGNPAGCTDQDGNLLTTDQRGVARVGTCDIGAYEYTTPGPAASLSVVGGSNQTAETTSAFPNPLQAATLDSQGSPVSGVTIDFTAPASGPSGTFENTSNNTTSAITDEGGVATTSTFMANDQAGAYTVSASANGLGSVNFNLEQVDRPANDNFAEAEVFTSLPFTSIVDITNATNEQPNEPQNCYSMDRTVWYSFTPAESMVVAVNSADGAIFTNVNIYHAGSGISDLQFLSCTGAAASTSFMAEANQTYYLQAGSAPGEVGYIRIDLDQFPAPLNDNFAAATPVSSLPSTIDFDTTGATFESNEPAACGYPSPPYKTIWYSFTASQTGSVSASIPSSSFAPFLAIYSGTSFNNLTQLGCGQYSNRVTFRAVQGQTYYLQVGGYYGEGSTGTFRLETAPAPLANFYFYPGDPSKYDTIQFCSSSYDPGNVGIQSFTWNFGDGATATEGCATHRYTADGNYTVQHTVTTIDGRTAAANPQVVQVRTHDVAITKITAPNSANSGQSKAITVTLRNQAYPETVQLDLYKSTPGGFVWVATVTKPVPALSGNRTTSISFNYTFTSDDARIGKVTFKVVATLMGTRDVFPIDNEAISSPPTKVGR